MQYICFLKTKMWSPILLVKAKPLEQNNKLHYLYRQEYGWRAGKTLHGLCGRSEGFPERDIWSLHVMDQGSCQIGRVLGTSPSSSVGKSILKYINFDMCSEISSSGPSHQIRLVKLVSNFPTRAKVNRKNCPKPIFYLKNL